MSNKPKQQQQRYEEENEENEEEDSINKKRNELRKIIPLIRPPTLSDLSSLSSSNPSYILSSLSPATGGPIQQQQNHHRHHHTVHFPNLPFQESNEKDHNIIKKEKEKNVDDEEEENQETKEMKMKRKENKKLKKKDSYRFSTFWKASDGKTGKKIIHVDNETGQAGIVTSRTLWQHCDHDTSGNILATLFLFGFILCPCWWVGAILFLLKSSSFHRDVKSISLWSPRTFGHLNCWMAAVSFVLIGILISMYIWYRTFI
ncbi:unnamed protein product [Cunninghamella echinulata]